MASGTSSHKILIFIALVLFGLQPAASAQPYGKGDTADFTLSSGRTIKAAKIYSITAEGVTVVNNQGMRKILRSELSPSSQAAVIWPNGSEATGTDETGIRKDRGTQANNSLIFDTKAGEFTKTLANMPQRNVPGG